MAGEAWRGAYQLGRETVYGTPVAATRRGFYGTDSALTVEREQRQHRFQVNRRSNLLDATNGPQMASGTLVQPVDASELLELLLLAIRGGVTPTTPGGATTAREWTFTEGDTLDSATVEWDDGARAWRMPGTYVNTLRFAGAANGEHLVTAELFGTALAQNPLTAALPQRTPGFSEGWETRLYIDAFGAVPGTTPVAGAESIANWDVTIDNQLQRKFLAANTNAMTRAVTGELAVTATLTIEASGAQAQTEFDSWASETKRLVRLEFGNNDVIEAGHERVVTLDLPGAWSAFDLGSLDAGTRVYAASYTGVFDPTNAFMVRVRCVNDRLTAF